MLIRLTDGNMQDDFERRKFMRAKTACNTYAFLLLVAWLAYPATAEQINLPYGEASWMLNSTYGQLTRLSDAIFIGNITGISSNISGQLNYAVAVEKVLFGIVAPDEIILQGDRRNPPIIVPPQRGLIFLPSQDIEADLLETSTWGWKRNTSLAVTTNKILIRYAERAIIPLDGVFQTELESLVEQYLYYLGDPTPDKAQPFFWFMHGLLSSEDERIRNDAKADMIFLCHSLDGDALSGLCSSTNHMEPGVREYAENAIKWRREGENAGGRDLTPSEEQIRGWIDDIRSGDRSRNGMALLEMNSRTNWLWQSTSVWVDAVAGLLTYSNQPIKLLCADMLSQVGDRRAVPALIDGLESDTEGIRKGCWDHLKRFYGAPVDYDPVAPEVDRRAMAAAWKNWYLQRLQFEENK